MRRLNVAAEELVAARPSCRRRWHVRLNGRRAVGMVVNWTGQQAWHHGANRPTAALAWHLGGGGGGVTPSRSTGSLKSSSRGIATATTASAATDTIYALSTAPGRAAIAVIRASGPACTKIYKSLCPGRALPRPRMATLRSLWAPNAAGSEPGAPSLLDAGALVLRFPGPATVTGDDVLELHVHGGPAVVRAVLAAVGACSSPTEPVRYAEAGEFTRRAFANDRLSLPQVEALGDTLAAVTEEQRRLAVAAAGGGLGARYEGWRRQLLAARGELEALIDFAEDQHFDESPGELAANVAVQVRRLVRGIRAHSANAVRGELLRAGISLALIGAPNAGKSSLLNAAVGRNAAIVSSEAGTTRDVVEVGLDVGGFYCLLGDTAGLRGGSSSAASPSASNPSAVGHVEREGIRRAEERAQGADVVLVVVAVGREASDNAKPSLELDPQVVVTARQLLGAGKTVVFVVNKMDHYGGGGGGWATGTAQATREIRAAFPDAIDAPVFCVSCRDAETAGADAALDAGADPGRLQALLTGLTGVFRAMTAAVAGDSGDTDADADSVQWQEALGATARQAALLRDAAAHLERFLEQVGAEAEAEAGFPASSPTSSESVDIVMAAEALRGAADCLARITGRGEAGDVEEVLGVVFEK